MGLWVQKPGCDFSSQPTVGSYTPGADGTHWLAGQPNAIPPVPSPAANAPVYEETAGAAVFKMICINCRGKRADSNGFIAQNLANLTGGLARVADFHDGFMGPASSPGANRHAAFGAQVLPAGAAPNWTSITDDDRAARYMAWMALGGTEVIIPTTVLQIVGVTPVLGVPRDLGTESANMLASAKALCASLLGTTNPTNPVFLPTEGYLDNQPAVNPKLIGANGDAELWLQLCTFNNMSPVHVVSWDPNNVKLPFVDAAELTVSGFDSQILVDPEFYKTNASTVGDEHARVVSTSEETNGGVATWPQWPWCLNASTSDAPPPAGVPLCPAAIDSLAQQSNGATSPPAGVLSDADANRWAVRGAMNAGFSVYLYLKSLETMANPPPDFNQCELLQ
jgi:hypothetical protein